MVAFRFAIEQVRIAPPLRLIERSPANDLDECGKLHQFIGRGSIHLYPLYPSGKLELVFRKDGYCLLASIKTDVLKRAGQGNPSIGPSTSRAAVEGPVLEFRRWIFETLATGI
jgi:hypothetical protein